MLQLNVEGREFWDSQKERFYEVDSATLKLEHSLVSISKWESKHNKPFLSDKEKTKEETFDYIRCMSLNDVDPRIVYCISESQMEKVVSYIDERMSASWINNYDSTDNKKEQNATTSEVIYAMMFELGIPMECENWHFNRLIMQIRVSAERQKPEKKMTKQELIARNRRLNEERRKKWNTNG